MACGGVDGLAGGRGGIMMVVVRRRMLMMIVWMLFGDGGMRST
jgi:hypothetical protein